MRERHFMEDENELPFLVSRTDDDDRNHGSSVSYLNINFKDLPFKEFSYCVDRLILLGEDKANLISSVEVKPDDCTFSIHQTDDKITMDFTVKNQYLSSTVTASYNTDSHRIEIDYISDDHRGLESSSWFIREVESVVSHTGMDYDMTFGGFRIHVEDGRLIIGDVGYVSVIFSKDVFNDDSYEYRVDFENKKLIMDVVLSSTMYFARFML